VTQDTHHVQRAEPLRETDVVVATPVASDMSWWRHYRTRVLTTDALCVLASVMAAYLLRFNGEDAARVGGTFSPSYQSVSLLLIGAWFASLTFGRTQRRRTAGFGPDEYMQVISVTWRLFAAIAVGAYLLHMEVARGYLIIAMPLGLTLLLTTRLLWRRWLNRRRASGQYLSRVVVVGHQPKVEALIRELRRHPNAGLGVVGVCLPAHEIDGATVEGVPVLGVMEGASLAARSIRADAVAVAGSNSLTANAVRRLGWDLEGSGIDLVLAPSLIDIAGPRVVVRPVNGLPLMYIDEPRFTGPKYVVKTVMDWVGALLITIALSPVLVLLAVLVRTTSTGPIFFTQQRVGVNGKTFSMLKFRSMVVNAHDRLGEVLAAEGIDHVGLFYKPKNDPRVTTVGRVLRKYSMDELPQLFNVLAGQMSLVGPRPQIDEEVAQYDRMAHRRLLVKPGLTGLWQVSGRSQLSAEEGIRMDVYYVENWTPLGDLAILARTAKAVLGSDGAY
jgi:exopolysaccharide biosynthesis polyprenyl glycosylphosphotransferase